MNWKAVEDQRDLLGIKVVDCGHVLISIKILVNFFHGWGVNFFNREVKKKFKSTYVHLSIHSFAKNINARFTFTL